MPDLIDVVLGDGDPLAAALRARLEAWMIAFTTVTICTGIEGDDLTDLLTWVAVDPHDDTVTPAAGTAALHAFEWAVMHGTAIGWNDRPEYHGLLPQPDVPDPAALVRHVL